MSDNEESIEVPVLELEFDKFLEICKNINIVDCITVFSMPNHVKSYADREKCTIGDLVMELIDYQKEENEWRLEKHKVEELTIIDNSLRFLDKILFDSPRIVIISKMNSAFIIPGEQSIKEGKCLPNQIIKFSNMISSQLFLLQFKDVKREDESGYDLKVDFNLINRTRVQEINED